jgi:hypothetical protein
MNALRDAGPRAIHRDRTGPDAARTTMSPFMRFLVTTVKWVRAAGLPRDPNGPSKPAKTPQDWESLGRDLGRAVRKFRDGGKPGG